MMINYQVVALFICCLSEDLIKYYNPTHFLRTTFPDVKEHYIKAQIGNFMQNQEDYIIKYKKLLETESNESIYKILDALESLLITYANQMEHPGFKSSIIFRFQKNFGQY